MRAQFRLEEIDEIDRFMAAEKHLYERAPEFGPSNFAQRRRSAAEYEAKWPIVDSLGVIGDGQLRIVSRPGLDDNVSISVIFKNISVSRLDLCPRTVCHPNPLIAITMGLPPTVCGSHFHAWEHNRDHILDTQQATLPFREELPAKIRRFDQAFPWMAEHINLVLTPGQRAFDVEPRLA
jgi:hypothetical protein